MGPFRRSPQEREYIKQVNRDPVVRRACSRFFTVLLLTFGVLFLMIALLSPQLTGWLWGSAAGEVSPAHDLLTGYLRWYWLLLILCGAACGGSAVLLALCLPRAIHNWVVHCGVWKEEVIPRLEEIDSWDMVSGEEKACHRGRTMSGGSQYGSAALWYFASAALCFLILLGSGGMLQDEHIPSLPFQAKEDLTQIETSFLVQAEVWISPKARPSRLPGPYGEGQPAPVTCYGAVGRDTGGEWVRVYVPNALDFSPDQERLYDETRTAVWNWEHARRYRVRYTSNFHLAVEITPVED